MAQMRRTVPLDPAAPCAGGYGLGLFRLPSACGELWGHDGIVFGYITLSLRRADGVRSLSLGATLSH
jgi:D-alanyl-D-alanine carboxypeptidase